MRTFVVLYEHVEVWNDPNPNQTNQPTAQLPTRLEGGMALKLGGIRTGPSSPCFCLLTLFLCSQGRCYSGECKTRDNQCQYIWGTSRYHPALCWLYVSFGIMFSVPHQKHKQSLEAKS